MAEHKKVEQAEPGWGWIIPEDDTAHGAWETRDACLADAREYFLSFGTPLTVVGIDVGRCIYPAAKDFVPVDLDEMLERMDEMAGDDDFYADDRNFKADGGAKEALQASLMAWAEEHVTATIWTLRDTERVDLVFGDPAAVAGGEEGG